MHQSRLLDGGQLASDHSRDDPAAIVEGEREARREDVHRGTAPRERPAPRLLEIRRGRDAHHMAEAIFKGLARAMDAATRLDPRVTGIPSTKDVL